MLQNKNMKNTLFDGGGWVILILIVVAGTYWLFNGNKTVTIQVLDNTITFNTMYADSNGVYQNGQFPPTQTTSGTTGSDNANGNISHGTADMEVPIDTFDLSKSYSERFNRSND